jgi:hypothetical protein
MDQSNGGASRLHRRDRRLLDMSVDPTTARGDQTPHEVAQEIGGKRVHNKKLVDVFRLGGIATVRT